VPLAIGTIFGERLYYIPSLGICLLPGILWAWLRQRRPQSTRGLRVFLAVVALWCAGNLGVVVQRTMAWRDSGSLFTGDVLTYPMSIDLHRKCSSVYASDGPRKDFDKAIAHLVEARRIKPDYAHAYRELGKIYVRQRKWAAAIAEFERVIELGPGYGDPLGAETIAYNAIGDCKMGMSEDAAGVLTRLALIDEAIAWYARSTVAPKWGDSQGEAHNHIGMAILRKASAEPDAAAALRLRMAALRRFEQTIALGDKQQPSHARAYRLLFDSLLVERKPVVPIREILRIWPAAWEIVGRHQDHELALLMGGLAYHARLPTEYVFEPLHWVSHACPPDKRDAQFYKARLFYSDALVERGRAGEARAVLEALLLEPKFPAELKPMVQGKLRGE
jgi:tetratricopeptide (TPR) repeat protein